MERNKKGQNSENTENHARHIRFDSIAAADSKWTIIKSNGNSAVAYFVRSGLFCAILEGIQEGSYLFDIQESDFRYIKCIKN